MRHDANTDFILRGQLDVGPLRYTPGVFLLKRRPATGAKTLPRSLERSQMAESIPNLYSNK